MNLLDAMISAVAPRIALKRERARALVNEGRRVGFWRQAAVSGTKRAMSGQRLDHPDGRRNSTDRITCIREARHLAENCAIVKSILRKVEVFGVGRLSYMPRTSSEAVNREYKAYVDEWMHHADYTGRHTFRKLVGLAAISMQRDGDCGFAIHEDTDTLKMLLKISPIRLQAIEADRIGMPYGMDWRYSQNRTGPLSPWTLGEGERDFAGVVVDQAGRPKRYRIYARREDDCGHRYYDPDIEIPAESFIHVFDSYRLDGYRGFTAFDAALNDIKDAMEILACEKVSVKHSSSISGVVTNKDGVVDDDVLMDVNHADYNANADKLKEVMPGEIKYLANDEDFKDLSPDRPSTTFQGFLDSLVRMTGLSLNLPFGFVYSWASQGTAVRMEAAQADREFQQLQLILEERLLDPVVQRVLARGQMLGHIPKVGDWMRGEWRYPARVTADVGRESAALIEENMAGHISKTQIAQDRGEDREIIRSTLKKEALDLVADAQEIVTRSGGKIDLPTALFILEKRAPNAPAAQPPPQANPKPENGENEPAPVRGEGDDSEDTDD